MVKDKLELLITVVVGAEDDGQAREACHDLVHQIGGRIIESGDCSDEEPGCWSVTISQVIGDRVARTDTASIANAVRRFMRSLGSGFSTARVSCEPPTAWTVLDDPEVVGLLVPGGERLLVEAWAGGSPPPASGNGDTSEAQPSQDTPGEPSDDDAYPVLVAANQHGLATYQGVEPSQSEEPGVALNSDEQTAFRLRMRVDVAADRAAGAEWQARALASRIVRAAVITDTAYISAGLIGVDLDLGPVDSPEAAVRAAVSALRRPGWEPLSWAGDTAIVCWVADPRPAAGITAVEISAGPPHPGDLAGETSDTS